MRQKSGFFRAIGFLARPPVTNLAQFFGAFCSWGAAAAAGERRSWRQHERHGSDQAAYTWPLGQW